ncbi:MAG: hypothetical protein U0289_05110 [Cyclobacteriaceae bacterium]
MTKKTTYYVMEISDESAAEFPDKYDWDSELSQASHRAYVRKNKEFPPFQPYLEQEIYDDPECNKVNDFIFGPVERYCISERVKAILAEFRLPEHRYYPVTVFKTKYIIKILWLRLIKLRFKVKAKYFALYYNSTSISDKLVCIDFKKTRITVEMLKKNKEHELDISSESELRAIFKEQGEISDRINELTDSNRNPKIGFEEEYKDLIDRSIYNYRTDKIYFNEKFDHSLDLFELRFSWMTYVSERLKDKLEKEKVTGLIFSRPGERQYKVKRPNPELIWD